MGAAVIADEAFLSSLGDEVLGIITPLPWAPTLLGSANLEFTRTAETKLKKTPSGFHEFMFSAGRWITTAADAVSGQVEDREKFMAALRRAAETTPDPRGVLKLDDYENPTQTVYHRRVERLGGLKQYQIIYEYPMVSQFWTYKPEEFPKAPAYDRNYPPIETTRRLRFDALRI